MSQVKVFVSSTCYDLKQIRTDMYNFISDMGFLPFLSEHPSFLIDPQKDIMENCIENVRTNTDIFILIVGNRYGTRIDTGRSITNTEYLAAKELGIPTYIFMLKSIVSILQH